MYKCPTCGEETEGRVNSRGQNRCTACYAILPADAQITVVEKTNTEQKEQEPKKPLGRPTKK